MSDDIADLAEAIRVLRAQLDECMGEGQDKGVRFELGTVHMEFEVVLTRDASIDGGVRFGVVSIGGKGAVGHGKTHRVSLELQPVVVDSSSPTGTVRALISGSEIRRPK